MITNGYQKKREFFKKQEASYGNSETWNNRSRKYGNRSFKKCRRRHVSPDQSDCRFGYCAGEVKTCKRDLSIRRML